MQLLTPNRFVMDIFSCDMEGSLTLNRRSPTGGAA